MEPENRGAVLSLVKKVREQYPQKTIWCYTGYHFDRDLLRWMEEGDPDYVRRKVNAQAYCAAYVNGKQYGADVSGFHIGKIAAMQANGQKDPQKLGGFLNDVRQAAYTIRNHMERNFGEQEQAFSKDDFSFEEPCKEHNQSKHNGGHYTCSNPDTEPISKSLSMRLFIAHI